MHHKVLMYCCLCVSASETDSRKPPQVNTFANYQVLPSSVNIFHDLLCVKG